MFSRDTIFILYSSDIHAFPIFFVWMQIPDNDDKSKKGKQQEVFHFVAYIPFDGQVYEIDGLRSGPIHIGAATADTWWDVARPAIEERMQRANDIKSVLLAVGRSRKVTLTERLELLQAQALSFSGIDSAESQAVQTEIQQVEAELEEDAEVRKAQKAENVLRRHNFFPMVLQLTRALAEKGQLHSMITAAKDKKRAAAARIVAAKAQSAGTAK
jgi:ubiquitin carboxyl-terminal hydrolase L5